MKESRSILIILILIVLILGATRLMAQEAETTLPEIQLIRAQEDYSGLADDELSTLLENMKFIPLNSSGSSFISTGGEARIQYEYFHNNEFGEAIVDNSGWMLHRTMFHAGITLNNLRVFGHLKSGFQSFAKPEPRSIDEDKIDLHELFAEYTLAVGSQGKLNVKIGRQELLFGSRRLISPRFGPNIRQAFDGGKLGYFSDHIRIDGFYYNYVDTQEGAFDNERLSDEKLYGLYSVIRPESFPFTLDAYYLVFESPFRAFDEGTAEETRHSIGVRLWNSKGAFRCNNEFVYQFGEFGESNISAYTLSFDLSYQLEGSLEPTLGLKSEIISGDKENGDGKLQTFNALYPAGAYFGLIALIGPSNLLDIHPSISLKLSEKVDLTADWDIFWRDEIEDGVYGPNATLSRSGLASNEKFLGHQPGFEIAYEHSRYLEFSAEGSWFFTGDFFEETGEGKDVTHLLAAIQFKF